MCEQTLVPLLCIPIQFYKIDIREDANTHKVISYKYLSNSICTVVEEFNQSDFCLSVFFFSTRFYLVPLMGSQGGAGFRCRFWCTIITLMPETTLVSLRTLAFFFPLATQTLFLFSTPLKPFRLFTSAPDSIFPCLASKFRNRSF